SDFKPLPVKLRHIDIALSFHEDRVDGVGELTFEPREPLTAIALDARDLTIHSVTWSPPENAGHIPVDYDYQTDNDRLLVTFPRELVPGETIHLRTTCTAIPSAHILEGIYRDSTPPGCPQQYMSQCQQWGFQRILPVFDDCTAKCTFTTRLEGDARYTHLIANGNIDPKLCPKGRPVPKEGDPSRQVIHFVNNVPMAPYLFIACAGTWDELTDEVVYPSGRRVRLEYLVPPGRLAGARVPMDILKESILWQERTQEYEYPFEVYRTISMEKSNFGGMENVGNTTIITSAALIDTFTSDSRIEYAHAVILHEFEHNQCGSEVTMETPFDMWLNEAFTVDVERQFMHSQFDPTTMRLNEIDSMRAPIHGPLTVEDGGHMGNIVREGFNDPDELVDGLTYVKAAEVIRMLKLILGPKIFRQAKNLYFHRYQGRNANTDQFFACFEEVSKRDLKQFKKEWLYTIGYPRVRATQAHEAKTNTLTISFEQTRSGSGGLFHIPIAIAIIVPAGEEIPGTAQLVELTTARTSVTVNDVPAGSVVSLNRDCSFYGTFEDTSVDVDALMAQVRLDTNDINRVEAMRALTDRERIRLIQDPTSGVSDGWLELYGKLLRDTALSPGLKTYLLRIDEQSLDRQYLPAYRERQRARETLLKAVADRHLESLLSAYESVDTYAPARTPKDGILERSLKAVLLRVITAANTPATQQLAESHFRTAWNITDRSSALFCINYSDHPQRHAIMQEARAEWINHLNGYMTYLMAIGSSGHDDVFERLREEAATPEFDIQHPSHSRALFMPMTGNNKMLWTDAGLQWLTEMIISLAPASENTTIRLLACLQQVNDLAPDLKPKVVAALQAMDAAIDNKALPSVGGRIAAYLAGAVDA
ncbi:MAG: M1 family metallopeptidase, partial [Verrucomicrobia bacterium]|nr:M1 family metallopeptidase [Verrucomicrobiota bacterium]